MTIASPGDGGAVPAGTITAQLARRPRVIELVNAPACTCPPWAQPHEGPCNVFRLPERRPSPAERHYEAAEAALAAFEAGGDWRHGLAALVHAVLSVDVTETGNR